MYTEQLKLLGLNIFAAIKMSKLPQDIIDIFTAQNIPYIETDVLCLIGNGGKELWKHLPHPLNVNQHSIDNFSIEQMKPSGNDIRILYPHKKWTIPLQKIGRFLNIGRPSMLPIDINKDFGLWFAYRGAFLTQNLTTEVIYKTFDSPCTTCSTKDCLKKDLHLARLACPYQREHQYSHEQLQYHMASLPNI